MSALRPILLLLLIILTGNLTALEVRSFSRDRNYITEGSLDAVAWYQRGLAAMTDFPNYNRWALQGLDGNDPVSEAYWEHFKDYSLESPDILLIKLTLKLPWPIGVVPTQARFQIDRSELPMDVLRMNLMDRPAGIEAAQLFLAAIDSPSTPGAKMIRFSLAIRFDPVIEILLDMDQLNKHMQKVIGTLAGNLEAYCR